MILCNQIVLFCDSVRNIKSELNIACMAALMRDVMTLSSTQAFLFFITLHEMLKSMGIRAYTYLFVLVISCVVELTFVPYYHPAQYHPHTKLKCVTTVVK